MCFDHTHSGGKIVTSGHKRCVMDEVKLTLKSRGVTWGFLTITEAIWLVEVSLKTHPNTEPATDKISMRGGKSQFDLIHNTPLVAASHILGP